nr:MAG TPA: hypothetical protein [Caudoviricetes sp.]
MAPVKGAFLVLMRASSKNFLEILKKLLKND